MELHTLGVNGGYTQDDVDQRRARVHRLDDLRPEPVRRVPVQSGDARSRREGRAGPDDSRAAAAKSDGLQVIDILARHPSTAQFISRKLAQRFVADDPPQALVDRMAATFTKTDGDLRAVMETLLLSREFLSEGAWQAKMKSPLEMVVSSLRALQRRGHRYDRAGAADHRAGPAAVRQVGADRLSEHRRAVDELGGPAGAHELRHGADRRTDRRRQGRDATRCRPMTSVAPSRRSPVCEPAAETIAAVGTSGTETALPAAALGNVIVASPDFQKR